MSMVSEPFGPILHAGDVAAALTAAKAALAALRGSQSYRQYKANGTLAKSKLGECERDLLTVIARLGG